MPFVPEPEVVAETVTGQPVHLVRLGHDALEVEVLTWGATLASVRVPDRDGVLDHVVLGFDDPARWLGPHPYLGAALGRYANRIAGGRFELDGRPYQVPPNDGPNALHGGPSGFDRRVWTLTSVTDGVELRLVSPDGEMGFPGQLDVTVTYTVSGSTLRLDYVARADAPTVVNVSNHAYFHLGGPAATIEDHVLTVDASAYLPVDEQSIPLGPPAEVTGTPFDFRVPTPVGARVGEDNEQLRRSSGYDHAYVLDRRAGSAPTRAVRVHEPTSGRVLEVWTDQPALQVYSGNKLDGSVVGRGGRVIGRRSALCLETEHYPDSPNHPDYPTTVLRPGELLRTTTELRFSTD